LEQPRTNTSIEVKRAVDLTKLARRARLLNIAITLSLASAVTTTLLISVGFIAAFLHINHIIGAAALFTLATTLFGVSLCIFMRETVISTKEIGLKTFADRGTAG
jgi:hypothetical protein